MKHLTFTMFFLLSLFGIANAADTGEMWDFHGIRLGASEEAVLKQFPDFKCSEDGSIRRCEAYFNFSKYPGFLTNRFSTLVFLVFVEDKLVNIDVMWSPPAFDRTYSKLASIYGVPLTEKQESITTTEGIDVENRTVLWHNGASTIVYDKYWPKSTATSRILYALK